jgi:hypothetical protein
MTRYMVERTFPQGLQVPVTEDGAQACLGVVDRNGELGVTRTRCAIKPLRRPGSA